MYLQLEANKRVQDERGGLKIVKSKRHENNNSNKRGRAHFEKKKKSE